MLINFAHQFIFFSVPKTASTSVEASLMPYADILISEPPRLKHTNIRTYEAKLQPYFEDGETKLDRIAIIREPLDWLYSWYCYRARPELREHENSTAGMSFEAFAIAYMQKPRAHFANIGQQSVCLTRKQSRDLGVDYLFRFEALSLVKVFFEDRLATTLEFPHLNPSEKQDGELSKTTEAALRDYLALDYEFYETAIA